ncbi:MAG: nucleotidyltransferase [Candidatus Tectomicrobia bacterium]|uniref:Nucleotidyltransferase n=1 Tax=Tectimicrobiota bacterium TaxID=2528274 RepID=A0A932M2P5_UNCTE|nr:nucleotidyltransferase [Candidatus Tectomicrobia bacterium]
MLEAERLLTALCKAEVAFVIIGGMAAVAQGSSYVTADLDICYQRQRDNYQRLSQALHPFNPRLRGAPADLPFALDDTTLKAGLNFTLTTEGGDLDLMGEVAGLGDYEAVKAHAEEVELYGYSVWVLTLEGLILTKQAAGRPKDLRLLPELKALQALRAESQEDER